MSILMKRAFRLILSKSAYNCKYNYSGVNNYFVSLDLYINNLYIKNPQKRLYSSFTPETHTNAINDEMKSSINDENDENSDIETQSILRTSSVSFNDEKSYANDVQQFLKEHNITVHGKDIPDPVFDLKDCQWPERIMKVMEAEEFEKPTPIQSQGWPIALQGRDLVGIAQTGSGKTLCYILPAFVKIEKNGIKNSPQSVVLAPTRELAQQIQTVVRNYRFVNSVCLFGGSLRATQMRMIRETNPQLIIATPGRLNDFIESSVVDLNAVEYLVLDEADRMLDMGFEPQIRRIIEYIPRDRQTLMWSATWPKEVRTLAGEFLKNYIQINVGGTELTANKNIKQNVNVCNTFDKFNLLTQILEKYPQSKRGENKILIFSRTKKTADFLANKLRLNGRKALSTHSDKSQTQRNFVLDDVDDIQVVINYDFPNSCEDYIHRIGRTGRCDNKGASYTFFTDEDRTHASDLFNVLKSAGQEVPESLKEMAKQLSPKQKRIWGYEPRQNDYSRPQRFQNNYNNNYNDDDYNYSKHKPSRFGDERSRMKRDLWMDNYSEKRRLKRDDYRDDYNEM